jgi:hypothetical protein
METPDAFAAAASLVWFGMVLAISFLETPLKFRAPGVTIPIGLGIGRLVFRALNSAEALMAVVAVVAMLHGFTAMPAAGAIVIAVACLVMQVLLVRPALARRTESVLAGQETTRSRAHWAYVGLEALKLVGLGTAGVVLLATA